MSGYGKRFRRRYNRYNRRTLSTPAIFSKTGHKSQARQIYALKRRVSAMNKQLRPEIKTNYIQATSWNLSSDQLTNTYKSFVVDMPAQGTADNERTGDMINVKNLQLNFTFEYYNNSQTGYHDSESAGAPVRIIIGQFKTGNISGPPEIAGVLEEYGTTGAAYTNQVISPLRKSQTEFSRILKDMRFTLTTDRNQKVLRINVRPRNYRINANGYTNKIWVMVVSSGLHFDSNFAENIAATFSYKLAYTDA